MVQNTGHKQINFDVNYDGSSNEFCIKINTNDIAYYSEVMRVVNECVRNSLPPETELTTTKGGKVSIPSNAMISLKHI